MTTFLRVSTGKVFQSLRTRSVFSSSGFSIETYLSPPSGASLKEPPHPHHLAEHVEHEEHDDYSKPPAVEYCAKNVFQKQCYVSSKLFPTPFNNRDKRYYSTVASTPEKKKIAVVLSGCGVHDGSEVQEAVSLLIHLSRAGVDAKCFAPDMKQADVINHVKGTPLEETRNVLVESARISRGKVKPLSQLKSNDGYAALIFPGGYGAAKNLSTFAKDGDNCTIQPDVERVIKEFHSSKKPIGLCCVSPVIAAKIIPQVRVTLGNEDKDITDAITRMGAKPESAGVTDVVVDDVNKVVSTPAYMCNASLYKVHEGIGKLVDTVVSLTTEPIEPTEPQKQAK